MQRYHKETLIITLKISYYCHVKIVIIVTLKTSYYCIEVFPIRRYWVNANRDEFKRGTIHNLFENMQRSGPLYAN